MIDAETQRQLDEYKNADRVRAEVFKASGKWAYTVLLDYSRTAMIANLPSGFIDPAEAAELALAAATANGTSGVVFSTLPEGWFMFVPDPPNGWPIMVAGGA